MAKQLYDYWFVQFDFPNEEGKPYKSSGGAMVWNERLKREIPASWQVENLIDFAEIKNGATPSTTGDANYGGNIVWINPRDLSTNNQIRVPRRAQHNKTGLRFLQCEYASDKFCTYVSRAPSVLFLLQSMKFVQIKVSSALFRRILSTQSIYTTS